MTLLAINSKISLRDQHQARNGNQLANLENQLNNTNQLVFFVNYLVVKLEFNIEPQKMVNILKHLLQCTKMIISFNLPLKDSSIFYLSEQRLTNLFSEHKDKLRNVLILILKSPLEKNLVTFAGSHWGPQERNSAKVRSVTLFSIISP